MIRLKRLKTLLLGLALILITFTIFIALPATLPSFEFFNCQRLWCSANVVTYHTWIWDKPEQPDNETIKNILLHLGETDGLRLVGYKGPAGKLNITADPENENHIIVSGYLQYGNVIESENSTEKITSRYPVLEGYLANSTVTISLIENYGNNIYAETRYELTTNSEGLFSVEIEHDHGIHCYTITADYRGEIINTRNLTINYLPCWVVYSTCEPEVFDKHGIPWWVWLVIGLAVIIGVLLLYWYLKRRRKYTPEDTEPLPSPEEIETPEIPVKKQHESGGDTDRIEITFPDIEDPLQAVWGVGESLNVLIRLKDRDGNALPSQTCEVDWGDGETVQGVSDEDGRTVFLHVYTIKQEYMVNARFTDKDISSWRRIRIVDYREEMVHLFSEMLETLNIRDISIDPKMTAREAEVLLTERLERVSVETIRKVVAGFEEANYSVHSVQRQSYIEMYMAVREILGHGG